MKKSILVISSFFVIVSVLAQESFNAWYRGIGTNFGLVYRDNFYFKNFGLSVRCLKD